MTIDRISLASQTQGVGSPVGDDDDDDGGDEYEEYDDEARGKIPSVSSRRAILPSTIIFRFLSLDASVVEGDDDKPPLPPPRQKLVITMQTVARTRLTLVGLHNGFVVVVLSPLSSLRLLFP